MPWRPWSTPSGMGHPLADVPGGPDLLRRFAAAYHGDGESLQQIRAFPLAGGRLDGRVFWAVFDPAADTCRANRRGVSIAFASNCTAPVLAVYKRNDGDWRAVTQRRVWMDAVSVVAPVNIEPSQAWIVTRGMNHRNVDANEPLWEVLRFDSEALGVEVVENWLDAMILDVDLDGALDILGSRGRRLCFRCSVPRRAVRLYRWTGDRMVAAPLEFRSGGPASGAAVAANNRSGRCGQGVFGPRWRSHHRCRQPPSAHRYPAPTRASPGGGTTTAPPSPRPPCRAPCHESACQDGYLGSDPADSKHR